jgi:hypothetical protein
MFGSVFFAGAPFGSTQGSDAGGSGTGGSINVISIDIAPEVTIASNITMI